MVVDSFYKYLISNGYYFDKELIENYLLSLKVKPFVILTGNSGTGKTKLSQLFAKYIDSNVSEFLDSSFNRFVTVKGKVNYSSWSNMGWTIEKNYFVDFLPIRQCETNFQMFVDDIPAEGNINMTVQLYYDSIDLKNYFKELFDKSEHQERYSKSNVPEVDIKIECGGIKSLLDDYKVMDQPIIITQKANKSAFNERQWMMNADIFEYLPFKKGYINCNIEIEGITSTARLRVLPRLSFKKNDQLQNYLMNNEGKNVNIKLKIDDFDFDSFEPKWGCDGQVSSADSQDKYVIVPVGANWTDNSNIVGYFNVITGEYQSTPTYNLINDAEINVNDPYFLILDEMNLSHVERYFADFLSAIESGEAIPLYGEERTLNLPNNLFTIGTVNVDETTYMFSPKVLDRANTIEFNTISAWEYMVSESDSQDFEGNIDYLQSPLSDSDISTLTIGDLKSIFNEISHGGDNLWDTLAIELTAFQETLKGSGFDFGFRVINEILRFMVVAWKYENSPDEWDNWERYFDAQIKQKILPKLHGSEKAIGNVLNNLFNLCLIERNNNENPKNFNINENNCRYYTSAAKLQNMSKVLSDQRYVSFIN